MHEAIGRRVGGAYEAARADGVDDLGAPPGSRAARRTIRRLRRRRSRFPIPTRPASGAPTIVVSTPLPGALRVRLGAALEQEETAASYVYVYRTTECIFYSDESHCESILNLLL